MSRGNGVSDDDLQEQAQILNRFQPISEVVSFTDSKNKNEAQITYQSLYIGIQIMRELLEKMHGVEDQDFDRLEKRASIFLNRCKEKLREEGKWPS